MNRRPDSHLRSEHAARRGYVLIVVLALLVVAALMTAGIARRSLVLAHDAVQAERHLQAKWTGLSFQRTVLARAEMILAGPAGSDTSGASHAYETSIRLNSVTYRLVLADEDAKLNLNTAFYAKGEAEVARLVRDLRSAAVHLPVRLRPYEASSEQLPVFDSWGQVFDLSRAAPGAPGVMPLVEAAEEITCWGSGRLNVQRASDAALHAVIRLHARGSIADELLNRRSEQPAAEIDELLDGLDVRLEEREALSQTLQDGSTCHSLWIQAAAPDRNDAAFYVSERNEFGRPYVSVFVW